MSPASIYYLPENHYIVVNGLREPFKRIMRAITSEKPLGALDKLRLARDLIQLFKSVQSLPEPAVLNTRTREAHILIGIRDEFFKRSRLPFIEKELRSFVNFIIIIIDTDFYRPFISWWVIALRGSDWPPLGPMQPDPHYWDESQKI